MKILYDATPLLMRSAGVKNYHHSLLKALPGIIAPHQLELFPSLKELKPNDNEGRITHLSRLHSAWVKYSLPIWDCLSVRGTPRAWICSTSRRSCGGRRRGSALHRLFTTLLQ